MSETVIEAFNRSVAITSSATGPDLIHLTRAVSFQSLSRDNLFCNLSAISFVSYPIFSFQSLSRDNLFCNPSTRRTAWEAGGVGGLREAVFWSLLYHTFGEGKRALLG